LSATPPPTVSYTLSLHDALPILHVLTSVLAVYTHFFAGFLVMAQWLSLKLLPPTEVAPSFKKSWRQFAISVAPLIIFVATTGVGDRKSTRLNSSHDQISYAVFCL